MTNYKRYYELLLKNRFIQPVWGYILDLANIELEHDLSKDTDQYLILFAMLFALIDEGNICMSLDKDVLTKKWNNKIKTISTSLLESSHYDEEELDEISKVSVNAIDNYLDLINEEYLPSLIGEHKMFLIDNRWIYPQKYYYARRSVIQSIDRLFKNYRFKKNTFDYKTCIKQGGFYPSFGQEKAIINGYNNNLVITGGPGTGKTTSILFLLINLLKEDKDYIVYLVAPSGKASSRMKDSIINGLNNISQQFKDDNPELIDKINNLEESTIHRLLSLDFDTNAFSYNKKHQFNSKSLFVIDEASMIDVCLFSSLLEAIPSDARVFIMGDKNQLPSVGCGAVFGDLLKIKSLQGNNNIVELDESIRFKEGTDIFNLAKAIKDGDNLPTTKNDWKDPSNFEVIQYNKKINENKLIYYYDIANNEKTYITKKAQRDRDQQTITQVVNKWGETFFKTLQDKATDLDPNDKNYLNELFSYMELSRILTAENEGVRGVLSINNTIVKCFIDKSKQTSVYGYYTGEIMMINTNNKMLDLYNGDSGLLVTFKDDPTLYFMVKKASMLVTEECKQVDKVFKLGDYVFYPLRLITKSEIDFAYAITIHKSQGSDYENILVILPTTKGHSLLNRQIVYTAITRTKGNTFILASQELLESAKDNLLERDTNIA